MMRVWLLLLCAGVAPQALAWGALGHRITGEIAMMNLTPAAAKRIQTLLGEETLAEATTFMDRQRQQLEQRWPDSARWHYDNQPVCGQRNYCRDGDCATQQIPVFQKRLTDSALSQSERALALRLLVHMVGDIHQPLHMSDNRDRGGNEINVRLYAGAERQNLHEVLDTTLVREIAGRQSARAVAERLLKQFESQLATWRMGTPTNWAAESHRLGVERVYGGLPQFACNQTPRTTLTLPAEQVQSLTDLTAQQLTRAGLRIAALLNASLR